MNSRDGTRGGTGVPKTTNPRAVLRCMAVLLAGSIPVAACRPGVYTEPIVGVEVPDPWEAEDMLREGTDVTFRVRAEYELPVVEVKVEFPDRVESWSTAMLFDDSWFHASLQHRRQHEGEGAWVNLSRGEITLGGFETFGMFIKIPDAKAGESYSFPVRLTLSDSSVVWWDGPPGSEHPAPVLYVGDAPPRVPVLGGTIVGALAFIVLLVAGLYWIRQRRSNPI